MRLSLFCPLYRKILENNIKKQLLTCSFLGFCIESSILQVSVKPALPSIYMLI
jgi:hypothetical protein